MVTSTTSTAPASATREGCHLIRGHALQVRSTGATTRAPIVSPSHHCHHREPYTAQEAAPPRQRLVTPTVALTVVLTVAERTTRPRTSWNRSRELRNSAKRLSR